MFRAMFRAIVLAAGLTPLASLAHAGDDQWSQAYRIPGQGTSFRNAQSVGIHEDTVASVASFTHYDHEKKQVRDGITVYIHKRTPGGWFREQALHYFDRPSREYVIGRVAISADRIIACAPGARSIIPLVRNAEGLWVDDPNATLSDGGSDTREAAFDDDHIFIGRSYREGYVDVYSADWQPIRQIFSPNPSQHGRFGYSLALEEGTLVISEPGSQPSEQDPNTPLTQGRVHIFTRDTDNSYALAQTLEPPTPELGALFGASVSMHNGVLAVGAPDRVNPDSPKGAVYIFRRAPDAQWALSDIILAPDSITFDETGFGRQVNLRPDRLAIAAPNARTGLYIYERTDDEWSLTSTIQSPLEPTTAYSLAGTDDYLAFGAGGASSTALYVAPREPECFRDLRGDANSDNITDFRDLNQILADFGLEGDDLASDLNNDAVVDFTDLNFVLFTFGSPCLPHF